MRMLIESIAADRKRFEAWYSVSLPDGCPAMNEAGNEWLKQVAWLTWQAAVAKERERAAAVADFEAAMQLGNYRDHYDRRQDHLANLSKMGETVARRIAAEIRNG